MPGSVVLVVDPVVQTAERVAHALAGTRFTVCAVRDAAEAEEVLTRDVVVAVLAAINLHRGNAYDFARHVRARHPAAAVVLVSGGFDVFNAERAAEVGAVRLSRPFTVEAVRRQLEAALGPLTGDDDPLDAALTLEPLPETEDYAPPGEAVPVEFEALASVGDERLASFLPRDWRALPPVSVDPSVVAPAMERAILAVLPQVVEAVLNKAMSSSPAFREMVEVAVEDALREELPAIVRRVVRERMAEIERVGG
ncbi:MAG: response regulator [Myxococcales bacterium]|nr:response regulator [Myxococcales bacterium]